MDENEVVERARQGDREAFRMIVERHKDRVYAMALGFTRNHHDAEDVVQEVFIRAFRHLARFRGDSRLSSWLYRVAANVCKDWYRRRPAAAEPFLAWGTDDTDSGEAPPAQVSVSAADTLRAEIDRAILRLTPTERSVFVLRHVIGLSTREAARTLGRSEGTIKNLLFRALGRLRRELAPDPAGSGATS